MITYIVSYDISNDKLRNRVSDVLEGYGFRVQESVFECQFNPDDLGKVVNRLENLITNNDNIRIYPLCKDCIKKALEIGKTKLVAGKKGYAIF
jgi:CRISPR-associated protein Cas2